MVSGINCKFAEGDDKHEISLEQVRVKPMVQHDGDEDTTCGIWFFRGAFLQKFANRKAYVILFGLLGCLYSASYAYFSGTLSTVEKRFSIPSKVTGIITVGNDISSLIVSTFLTYYASRKHQPRWIGFGMYTIVLFCLLSALPHFIFGPGHDALHLTKELGRELNDNVTGSDDLCDKNERSCRTTSGNLWAPIILFIAQFVSGFGGTLYHTLGVSYMDDNLQRSKTPMMLSFTYFIRSLGPVLGFFVSSVCLKLYIAPTLSPIINNKDPRWLGAWWLGWIAFAILIFVFSTLVTMFPKQLPKTKERKEKEGTYNTSDAEIPASFADMKSTFKRLFTNGILMCNNLAAIFYVFGAMPFFIFAPKYLEIMFSQSAAFANLISGTVGLACSAIGILLSGVVLSKYKPRARPLAAWNVFCGFVMVSGIVTFSFLECSKPLHEKSLYDITQNTSSCNENCNCDYVKYSPVCSVDKSTNFISPCHAGCTTSSENNKVYYRCKCVENSELNIWKNAFNETFAQAVTSGPCPVDCHLMFTLFLIVVCILQLIGATGKTSNFLVAVRCVDDKDKPVAMGIGLTMISIFAFIPSPILFGYIIDQSCIVWGKTCIGKGNCWLYNSRTLRYSLNYTSAAFIAIGVIFDVGVWYLAKDIQIFDETIETKEKKSISTRSPAAIEKNEGVDDDPPKMN